MENKKTKMDWNMLNLASGEMREQIKSQLEEIKKKRGQIITWALETEELLEGILTNYFMRHNQEKEKTQFFEVEVIRGMKFDTKVQILEKVLKQEKYDKEKLLLIIKVIQNIQQMRNKAAHWRNLVFLKSGEVKLRKKSEISKEEMLSLSDEMLNKLEEDKETAFQEIIKFHNWSWDKEVKSLNERIKEQFNRKD